MLAAFMTYRGLNACLTCCAFLWLGSCASAPTELGSSSAHQRAQNAAPPVVDLRTPPPSCPNPPPPSSRAAEQPVFIVQQHHSRPILRAALSGNGRILATSAFDGTVRIWDTQTGLLLRRILTEGNFSNISISNSGNTLVYYAPDATAGGQTVIAAVDLGSDAPPRPFTQYGEFKVFPDGKTAAVGLTNLSIYDVKTGAVLRELPLGLQKNHIVLSLALDPEGKRIALSAPGEIIVIDLQSFQISSRFPLPALSGPMDHARELSFAGDQLIARNTAGIIHIINSKGGTPAIRLAGTFLAHASTNDRIFTIDQNNKPAAWDAKTGISLPFLAADPRAVHLIAASADGSTLALIAADQVNGNAIALQDGFTMSHIRTIESPPAHLRALALHPSGTQFATGSQINTMARWNLASGELMQLAPFGESSPIECISYDGKGEQIAWTSPSSYFVRVRENNRGRMIRQWRPHGDQFVRFSEFLPNSSELITVAQDGSALAWNLGGPLPPLPPKRPIRNADIEKPAGVRPIGSFGKPVRRGAMSSDGKLIALDDNSGLLGVLEVDTGKVRWTAQANTLTAYDASRFIAFSPDSRKVLLSGFDLLPNDRKMPTITPTLRAFDAATGALLATEKPQTTGPMAGRGNTIVLGGYRPILLDAQTLARKASIAPIDREVTAVAAHPTRDLFLLSGDGGSTWIVSAQNAKVNAIMVAASGGDFMTSTPEGAFLSSLDGARNAAWAFNGPLEGFAFEQFSAQFDKPDYVRKRIFDIAGESAEPLAEVSRPPRLEFESLPSASTTDEMATLKAKVTSPKRVERVRAFVNGRPAADQLVCANDTTIELNVPLQAGRNRIGLVAYDAAGFASNPMYTDVVTASPKLQKPDLWIISIGVSEYPNLLPEQQLDFADDDAGAIAMLLSQKAGENRPFNAVHRSVLLNSQVTVDSVKDAIAKLSEMKPDDLAVLFFAGHGLRLPQGNMVFLTSQASMEPQSAQLHGIGWDHIQNALGNARGRVLVLLDACHSGHVSTDIVVPNEALARELSVRGRAGVLIFAAARGSQLSYEVPPSGISPSASFRGLELALEGKDRPTAALPPGLAGGHGLFTSALLEALAGNAPDRDRSGAIEIGEFTDFVTFRVKSITQGAQTPWIARRELFGDFVLAPRRGP